MRKTKRVIRLASSIAGVTILASCARQTRVAATAAPSEAECRIIQAESMGYRPGMNLDSIREASLDSAGVIFRQGRRPAITDSTKRLERNPRLLNQQWVEARMSELYPPELSRSMIGGRTTLGFFIRPDSTTDKMRVLRSSGHVELDRASVQVIQAARMAPGEYHGCAVWTLTVMPVNWVPRQGRSF